jgi:hypothetical protein
VCGTIRDVSIGTLRTGISGSCGCRNAARARRHGLSESVEYRLWKAMIQRCHNPRNSEYRNYGARGIRVCQRWRHDFTAFLADVGFKPARQLTLDRVDNDGDYQPGNVRWATRSEQMQNTRLTHDERIRRGRRNALKRWHGQ